MRIRQLYRRQEALTDLEMTVTDDTVPVAFNLNNSVMMKLPTFPAPITAKERKTRVLFVCERRIFGER